VCPLRPDSAFGTRLTRRKWLPFHRRRYGRQLATGDFDLQLLSRIRGDHFNAFLRRTRSLIVASGKKMQLHLNVEFLRPDPRPSRRLAYPWNISSDWRQWIKEGLLDEATLRNFQYTPEFVLADAFSNEIMRECTQDHIPIHYNRYTGFPRRSPAAYVQDLQRVYDDGRFRGFIIYETADFIVPDPHGRVSVMGGFDKAIRQKARQLNLL
jgi:hypothetical protein